MSTKRASATKRANALSHVAKASWGKGVGTLWRITRLNLRHPWQVTICFVATFIAASLQLMIPKLLGHAVDQAHGLGTEGAAEEQGLITTAVLLLLVSVGRGMFTLLQNYTSESVGHHAAYELRLACYEKLQQLSFSFHDRVHSGDLITLGIVDPVKVVRHALQDAASVAGLLITTEAMIAEKPKKEAPMPAGGPGGGMGDMDF